MSTLSISFTDIPEGIGRIKGLVEAREVFAELVEGAKMDRTVREEKLGALGCSWIDSNGCLKYVVVVAAYAVTLVCVT